MTFVTPCVAIVLPDSFPDGLSQLLFEQHWLYWIPLALAGFVLAWFARGGAEKIVRRVGLGMVGLAAVWVIAAIIFVTPRERLAEAHRHILKAAENADAQGIIDLMSPDFHFGTADRAAMTENIQAVMKLLKAKSNLIRYYQGDLNGSEADVHINILTTLDGSGGMGAGPYLTKWELSWKDAPPDATNPDGWQLTEIRRWWVSDGTNDQAMPSNFNELK